ncbi:MAG: PD-(D/E)XK nuclease family protein, partial [Dongiaceae bacterium]
DAQARDLEAGERKDIAARVTALLADPAFASLWQANGRAEQPIAGRLARTDGTGFAVAGQIDRLVIAEDAVWIVDYKTNRPPATRLDEVPVVYLKQMATYRALLADIYRNRTVRCFLLWTEVPSLMELPEELLCRHLP